MLSIKAGEENHKYFEQNNNSKKTPTKLRQQNKPSDFSAQLNVRSKFVL